MFVGLFFQNEPSPVGAKCEETVILRTHLSLRPDGASKLVSQRYYKHCAPLGLRSGAWTVDFVPEALNGLAAFLPSWYLYFCGCRELKESALMYRLAG